MPKAKLRSGLGAASRLPPNRRSRRWRCSSRSRCVSSSEETLTGPGWSPFAMWMNDPQRLATSCPWRREMAGQESISADVGHKAAPPTSRRSPPALGVPLGNAPPVWSPDGRAGAQTATRFGPGLGRWPWWVWQCVGWCTPHPRTTGGAGRYPRPSGGAWGGLGRLDLAHGTLFPR